MRKENNFKNYSTSASNSAQFLPAKLNNILKQLKNSAFNEFAIFVISLTLSMFAALNLLPFFNTSCALIAVNVIARKKIGGATVIYGIACRFRTRKKGMNSMDYIACSNLTWGRGRTAG